CHVIYGADIAQDLKDLLEEDDLAIVLDSKDRPRSQSSHDNVEARRILNVRGSADTEKIKEAYKNVMCLNHPDVGGKTSRGFVHLWQGDQDLLVSVTLQRYIAEKLPWIQYHELTEAGHMFPYDDGIGEKFLRALLLGMQ
ncbi:hypothetical protein IFM89_037160, partial [Coptis chinensis]